jgi:hypothetical protein
MSRNFSTNIVAGPPRVTPGEPSVGKDATVQEISIPKDSFSTPKAKDLFRLPAIPDLTRSS